MFGFDHPWFRPLGRRIATVVVCALWFALEWRGQEPFWLVLSGGALSLTVWALIVKYPKKANGDE